MRWLGFLVISALACSGRPQATARTDSTATRAKPVTPTPTVVTPPNSTAILPPMPRYPEAGPGRMVVVSAGPAGSEVITRDWPADAGLCENPSRLLVKSEQPGAGGTLLLLLLPDSRVTSYPAVMANRSTLSPPVAMAGIQVYSKTGPLAYQATEGAADLTALGERASGRFGLTLREVNRHDQLRYAGSFREVPVARLDSARCATAPPIGTPQH